MNPIWLSNMEWMLSGNADSNEAGVLRMFMPLCAQWIEGNRIVGDRDNEAVITKALALFTRMADWSMLRHDHPASDLRNFVIRLKHLLPKS